MAPGLWRGWGFFHDDTKAFEWRVDVTDLMPLAKYARVYVDNKPWAPPVPQDHSKNPSHAH